MRRNIGKILDISPTTMHFHIERGKKLGVRTRTQAAATVVSRVYPKIFSRDSNLWIPECLS